MSTQAIKKLRRSFISVAMLSFLLVMVFTGGLINVVNSLSIRRNVQDILEYIVENEGELPAPPENNSEDAIPDSAVSFLYAPEFRYTTRYFAVIYDKNNRVEDVEMGHIYSVNKQQALQYADTIRNFRSSFGPYGENFFYRKTNLDHGRTIVVVLDASTVISLNKIILGSTILTCGAGLILTMLAVLALSGRMIRPEIENARRQRMFITNASHELKTPLAVIRANTELEELMNGETEWSQSTLRQVDRLDGLIQNLVMIARAEEKEGPVIRSDFDASAVIHETVQPYEALALQQGKTLELDIAPDIHVIADESKIRQLAVILIDNAFKYCDEKGEVHVMFSRARIGRQVRFTVSNTYAEGKDVDYARFFDRFYREDTSHSTNNTRGKGGYGIGLSIADNICTQYRGNVRASWKDGVITFTCLLGI